MPFVSRCSSICDFFARHEASEMTLNQAVLAFNILFRKVAIATSYEIDMKRLCLSKADSFPVVMLRGQD